MGRKAEKFELNDIFGDAPNHGSHLLSASKARKYRCITSAIIAVASTQQAHHGSVQASMRYFASFMGLMGAATAAPAGDRVTGIPGIVDFPKFPVYSGCAPSS